MTAKELADLLVGNTIESVTVDWLNDRVSILFSDGTGVVAETPVDGRTSDELELPHWQSA
jgi:3-oxoacyl-[acyl-carrier-protein] synthase III